MSGAGRAELAAVRVVLITDRRLMGDGSVAAFGAAVARAVAALPVGAALVQVREKDLDGGPLLELVRAAMAAGAPVMVNDRLDVALAAGAAGVHLPEASLSIAEVRALAPRDFLIGCSYHSMSGFTRGFTGGADLLQFGPIYETPGKGPPCGLYGLGVGRAVIDKRPPAAAAAAVVAAAGTPDPDAAPVRRARPLLVAVGGIHDATRAAACRTAGADAVAAIRAAWLPDVATLA